MEDLIEEKLEDIYKLLNIRVFYKSVNVYEILIEIDYKQIIFTRIITYKYDRRLTLESNIKTIQELIDTQISRFYKYGNEVI